MEVLLYLAISSSILLTVSVFVTFIYRARVKNNAILLVNNESRLVLDRIALEVKSSTNVVAPLPSQSGAGLELSGSSDVSVVFELDQGRLYISKGSLSQVPLNSAKTNITSISFENLSTDSEAQSVRVVLNIERTNQNGLQEYQYSKTFYSTATIARLTAEPPLGVGPDDPPPQTDPALQLYYEFEEDLGSTSFFDSVDAQSANCSGGSCPDVIDNDGISSNALDFDGANDFLSVADGASYINGLSEFSVSVWVKADSLSRNDRGIFIATNPDGNDDVMGLRYDWYGYSSGGINGIKAGITVDTGTSDTIMQIESSSYVQTDEWQHLVLTWRSGEQLKLYVDGALDNPGSNSSAVSGTITGSDRLEIGRGSMGSNASGYWDGMIDEFKLWDRQLSASEIQDLYESY